MKELLLFICFVLVIVFGIKSCVNSDTYKAHQREADMERQKQETPHVIRTIGNCKVYTFLYDRRYHFFTECASGTITTETTHSEACGKNCNREVSEYMITQSQGK